MTQKNISTKIHCHSIHICYFQYNCARSFDIFTHVVTLCHVNDDDDVINSDYVDYVRPQLDSSDISPQWLYESQTRTYGIQRWLSQVNWVGVQVGGGATHTAMPRA